MNSVQALAKIHKLGLPVFRTADVVALLEMKVDAASKMLLRLSQSGLIHKVLRGLWCLPGTDPLLLPELLTAPQPAYISLQTALYLHGMISQVPQIVYAVSLSRTCGYKTSLGAYSIHHIQPDFFFGYESSQPHQIKMATPEKALLDVFYLTATKTRLFAALPEINLPKTFSKKRAQEMLEKIGDIKRRSLVSQRLKEIVARG